VSQVVEPGCVSATVTRIGNYRWRICTLLLLATTINYIDRNVLSLLAPLLQSKIGWNEAQYGYIGFAFQIAYAIGLLAAGRFVDRVGTRLGYAVIIGLWSLAAMSHSLVTTVLGFGIARFFLGLGESGNFPAAVKTVAEWFPKKERAFATGIFNSGANIGVTIASIVVPFIALHLHWQIAFLFTGALSTVWLVFWLMSYQRPERQPKLSPGELAYIQSDPASPVEQVPWLKILRYRQTWSIVAGKFMTDPIWWFLLFWLPKFLTKQHGLALSQMALPMIIVYNFACVGSIGGGWLPGFLINRGWSVNKARKSVMLLCALCVTPMIIAATVPNVWVAVGIISVAAAAHQGWSANLLTMASDMFPRGAVGSVTGIGGFGGAVASALISSAVGWLLYLTGSYVPVFIGAGLTYVSALAIIHLLVPRLQRAEV
jgi:ACS family hexuronate transporter-like MFS transporter